MKEEQTIPSGRRVALSWGQSDGKGFWNVTDLENGTHVKAAGVLFTEAITLRNDEGNKSLPGGPRGWVECTLDGYTELEP